MAVLFMDGFDHYIGAADAGVNDLVHKWTGWYLNGDGSANPDVFIANQSATGFVYARGGLGQALVWNGNSRFIGKSVPAGSTFTMGKAVRWAGNPSGSSVPLLGMVDGTTVQVGVSTDGAGHLTVVRGGTTLATSTNTVSGGIWYYVEFKATINSTTGVIELRVNGSSTGWVPSTGSLNTQNTGNATANVLGIGQISAVQQVSDDVYMLDSTGSVNTTFLGPVRVAALDPAQAGNYSQWTPNGGTNFANVADGPAPDGDNTFNQSSTAGQLDSYVYEDVPATSGSVFAIQHNIYARQDAGAQRTIARLIRRSGTDYVGSNQLTSTSYTYYLQVDETDPSTSSAWSIAGLNAAEFGVKLIS